MTRFADRRAAGRVLGERLQAAHAERSDAVVLGLPRGGVVVAASVAAVLAAPLDVLVVRKLGLPWQPELAMGAIAAVGDTVETVRVGTVLTAARIEPETFESVRQEELVELRRRESAYRDGRAPVAVAGRTVILVDDGLATGATMRAAVVAVRRQGPRALVVAVPVGSPSARAALETLVDELVCLSAPRGFRAVGQAYADFSETSDAEVRAALAEASGASP
jgi:putative phosphoribosyl transferase